MAKKQFKSESKRLLDLMINSIYTHKEIFLREIISNASDAIDKLCFISLTDDKLNMTRSDFKIEITADKENRVLTVKDNGIGMSKDELDSNLGTIASSGSYKFRQQLKEGDDTNIIGQFGVGFYSAFMVASEITVRTKKYGEEQAYEWNSSGADGYTVKECDKSDIGTEIIMKIKDDTEDENYSEFLQSYTIERLVKKYSDYIRYPIITEVETQKVKEGSDENNPEYETVKELRTLNSMVPLWQKNKKDVTQEEYDRFYMEKFFDTNPPIKTIVTSVEGVVTYKALLFIPEKTPFNYYTKEYVKGLQLYSSSVMIMENCEALLPEHFRFVKGIVDSQDLSLNISRELLQHDRQLKVIAQNLEKKIKNELTSMMNKEPEKYEIFFKNFGRQLKYGAVSDYGIHKDSVKDLLLFYSSTEKKPVSLAQYVSRMKDEQKYIYYATGESVTAVDALPQTELLKKNGYEILYCIEDVDEFAIQGLMSYADKQFKNVLNEELDIENEQKNEDEPENTDELLSFVKEALKDKISDAIISKKLVSHPVCLTAQGGISFEMEKYFDAVNQDNTMKARRVLELNASHDAVKALFEAIKTDKEKAAKYSKLLYDQALLIAGLPIENPSEYTDLVCSLMK